MPETVCEITHLALLTARATAPSITIMSQPDIPLLIVEDFVGGHIADMSIGLSSFLSGLEKRGVTLPQLPEEFAQVGCFNTACGGIRSNGSRTRLRNLVVLEGIEFANYFLENASKGAARLDVRVLNTVDPFLAEIEWLSLVGKNAAKLLDDSARKIHLLDAVSTSFFRVMDWHETVEAQFLSGLPEAVANELRAFRTAEERRLDQHYARVYAFVRSHPRLETVSNDVWNSRLDECARILRKEKQTGFLSALRSNLQ